VFIKFLLLSITAYCRKVCWLWSPYDHDHDGPFIA